MFSPRVQVWAGDWERTQHETQLCLLKSRAGRETPASGHPSLSHKILTRLCPVNTTKIILIWIFAIF